MAEAPKLTETFAHAVKRAYLVKQAGRTLPPGLKRKDDGMASRVQIKRVVSQAQHYPRSGNFDTQKPNYDWLVVVDGKVVECFHLLRLAKKAALDYGSNFQVIRA